MLKEIFNKLEEYKIKKNTSRQNVMPTGKKFIYAESLNTCAETPFGTRPNIKLKGSKNELYNLLKKFINKKKPGFKFSGIQVNKNYAAKLHTDSHNFGYSYTIAFGDFTGGELILNNKKYNIKNKLLKINGLQPHYVKPFKGTRYSLVFYTNKVCAKKNRGNKFNKELDDKLKAEVNKDIKIKKVSKNYWKQRGVRSLQGGGKVPSFRVPFI